MHFIHCLHVITQTDPFSAFYILAFAPPNDAPCTVPPGACAPPAATGQSETRCFKLSRTPNTQTHRQTDNINAGHGSNSAQLPSGEFHLNTCDHRNNFWSKITIKLQLVIFCTRAYSNLSEISIFFKSQSQLQYCVILGMHRITTENGLQQF